VVVRLPTHRPTLLPLGVGAGLARALSARGGTELSVKWPNDLVVPVPGRGARKLGGVLVDTVPSPTLATAAVVGIGINVATLALMPSDVRRGATSLADLGGDPPTLYQLEALTVSEVRSVARALDDPVEAGAILALCRERLYGVGRGASVDGRPLGTIEAIADDGALCIRTTNGRIEVRAGDLTVEEGP
jgi:BirA family transcriptional regulator, biotin operon repressor / biotin---[acetyl-CoA-carboxylase] ligase